MNVPAMMGRYQASHLPNCRAKYFAGEGHISIVTNHIREILAVFVQKEQEIWLRSQVVDASKAK